MRIALGQAQAVVGDFAGNAARAEALARRAREAGAGWLVLPELFLCGTPLEGLARDRDFLAANEQALETLAGATTAGDLAVLVGAVQAGEAGGPTNAAFLLREGEVVPVAAKRWLREEGGALGGSTFDEGPWVSLVDLEGCSVGISIGGACPWGEGAGRLEELADEGAELILDLSAVPYVAGDDGLRERLLTEFASRRGVAVASCNLVGGSAGWVFSGRSLAVGADGAVLGRGKGWEEDLVVVDLTPGAGRKAPTERAIAPLPPPARAVAGAQLEELVQALTVGIRDYVRGSGFERVLVGLSGGIDSAVVAALATLALGPEQVGTVFMPSRYTSSASAQDAAALAANLGVRHEALSIEGPFEALHASLGELLPGGPQGLTEENLQARIRGLLLMALSNQRGELVLTTSNRSEAAVGYSTLHGDMAGALGPILDLPKTWVYDVARHLNLRHRWIPPRILSRPPSAELRPDQTDQDSLPPYDVLDRVLHRLIDEGASATEIAGDGEDPAVVERIASLWLGSEYKRRLAAPAILVGRRSVWGGPRLPTPNRFRPSVRGA